MCEVRSTLETLADFSKVINSFRDALAFTVVLDVFIFASMDVSDAKVVHAIKTALPRKLTLFEDHRVDQHLQARLAETK